MHNEYTLYHANATQTKGKIKQERVSLASLKRAYKQIAVQRQARYKSVNRCKFNLKRIDYHKMEIL